MSVSTLGVVALRSVAAQVWIPTRWVITQAIALVALNAIAAHAGVPTRRVCVRTVLFEAADTVEAKLGLHSDGTASRNHRATLLVELLLSFLSLLRGTRAVHRESHLLIDDVLFFNRAGHDGEDLSSHVLVAV